MILGTPQAATSLPVGAGYLREFEGQDPIRFQAGYTGDPYVPPRGDEPEPESEAEASPIDQGIPSFVDFTARNAGRPIDAVARP